MKVSALSLSASANSFVASDTFNVPTAVGLLTFAATAPLIASACACVAPTNALAESFTL